MTEPNYETNYDISECCQQDAEQPEAVFELPVLVSQSPKPVYLHYKCITCSSLLCFAPGEDILSQINPLALLIKAMERGLCSQFKERGDRGVTFWDEAQTTSKLKRRRKGGIGKCEWVEKESVA